MLRRVEEKFDRARRNLCFVSGRAIAPRDVFPAICAALAESWLVAKGCAPAILYSLLNREEKRVTLGTMCAPPRMIGSTLFGRFA
jgi:hypothetical protein